MACTHPTEPVVTAARLEGEAPGADGAYLYRRMPKAGAEEPRA